MQALDKFVSDIKEARLPPWLQKWAAKNPGMSFTFTPSTGEPAINPIKRLRAKLIREYPEMHLGSGRQWRKFRKQQQRRGIDLALMARIYVEGTR